MKNIEYIPELTPEQFEKVLWQTAKLPDKFRTGASWLMMSMQAQHRRGNQVVISKEVSDALMNTEFPKGLKEIDDVPWISTQFECYFEDPALSTVLVSINSMGELMRIGGLQTDKDDGRRIFMTRDTEGDSHYSVVLEESEVADDLFDQIEDHDNQGEHFAYTGEVSLDHRLRAFQLVIMAMFYVDHNTKTVQSDISKRQLQYGGKAGVKGRPKRPTMRIVYLPRVNRVGRSATEAEGRRIKRPHMRRGHFKVYRDARYKNVRGKTIFVQPTWVSGRGESTKTQYRILKR